MGEELASLGLLSPQATAYLHAWLELLAPFALPPPSRSLCHGDVNTSDMLVTPDTQVYLAMIDWAGSLWSDNAYDLAVVSLRAAPWLLDGYRSVVDVVDATLEARLLWHHLRLAVFSRGLVINRKAAPGLDHNTATTAS